MFIHLLVTMVIMLTMLVVHLLLDITSVLSQPHIHICAVFNSHSNIICIFNMKLYKISLALLLGLSTFTSCNDKLELLNPNQQTTGTFGFNADDLQESVIAPYNHIRMERSYARVGYTIDVCRGDEAWNSSQVWYLPFDDLNVAVTDEICQWSWRDWYYTINVCNFILSRTGEDDTQLAENMKRIKGQALFIRGLAYYNLAGYYQNPPLITSY